MHALSQLFQECRGKEKMRRRGEANREEAGVEKGSGGAEREKKREKQIKKRAADVNRGEANTEKEKVL